MGEIDPSWWTLSTHPLTLGLFLILMKVAVTTPLLKKPSLDPDMLNHYRPVSIQPFLSKVLERTVAIQLTKYMDQHGLHDVLHSVYKVVHSTEMTLLKVQNNLLCTLDTHGIAVLILLDISAAFDTIDHAILLERMESLLNVHGIFLEWLSSCLI